VHAPTEPATAEPVSEPDWDRLRVALAHDYFLVAGGAERVAASLHEMFPKAPMYTSAVRPRGLPAGLDRALVKTTFLQRAPGIDKLYRAYLPLYGRAFESLDLSAYDLVVASSSAWAHRVTIGTRAPVVVYCHNPPRFLWQTDDYLRHEPGLRRTLATLAMATLGRLRKSDLAAAAAARTYVANSATVAARIRRIYGRDAEVIPPPIEVGRFAPRQQDEFAVVVTRLQPYKRVDLAIAACEQIGLPLRVVGDGAARRTLEAQAGPHTRFLGRLPDADVADLLGRARVLIVSAAEDFGLTPLEANASGCPVVAFGAGGALETVIPGQTGLLFGEATVTSLASALDEALRIDWERGALTAHAARYDVARFRQRMFDVCAAAVAGS
jgi:glycosyltransferase involved in cell wall biosynthesis